MKPHEFTLERGGKVFRLLRRPGRPGWYLRLPKPAGGRTWLKCGDDDQLALALDHARDTMRQARAGAHPYQEFREKTAWRTGATVGRLAEKWVAAGYARPTGARNEAQRARMARCLHMSLPWWAPRGLASVDQPTMKAYASWRAQHSPHPRWNCARCVEHELSMLSNLCAWAQSEGLYNANPFADRPVFHTDADVRHCHAVACESDEELHVLLSHLAQKQAVLAGWLCYQALTGQRPSEPGALQWAPRWSGGRPQPGTLYTRRVDGVETQFLAVVRKKRGQNPAVRVHPALSSFVAAWRAYHAAHWPESPWWFPNEKYPSQGFLDGHARGSLNRWVSTLCHDLGLSHHTLHSFRAFYVRVRRSQGALDAVIASEIGDGNVRLIRTTYGDPEGIVGDERFDWLPAAPAKPMWETLGQAAAVLLESNLESNLESILSHTEPHSAGGVIVPLTSQAPLAEEQAS